MSLSQQATVRRNTLLLSLILFVGVTDAQSQDFASLGLFEPEKTLEVKVVWPILDEKMRTWTDSSGKKTVVAALGGRTPDSLIFYRKDGERFEIPAERLCEADRAYAIQKTEKRVSRSSAALIGKIESIRNGDSFEMREMGGEKVIVRLDGLDAPDSTQTYGQDAIKWLSRFKGQTVRAEYFESDRHGRLVANVYVGDRWLNYEMILSGNAWHDHRINVDRRMSGAQALAKKESRGLWKSPDAISPWEYRVRRRSGAAANQVITTK